VWGRARRPSWAAGLRLVAGDRADRPCSGPRAASGGSASYDVENMRPGNARIGLVAPTLTPAAAEACGLVDGGRWMMTGKLDQHSLAIQSSPRRSAAEIAEALAWTRRGLLTAGKGRRVLRLPSSKPGGFMAMEMR